MNYTYCLIYDTRGVGENFPRTCRTSTMGDYGAFTEGLKKSGKFVGRTSSSQSDRTNVRRETGKSRPLMAIPETKGAARRLLPDEAKDLNTQSRSRLASHRANRARSKCGPSWKDRRSSRTRK